ncbi:MAG: PEP-CTERM sorting domain-containing protein [Fimbriimonadaceae bacterium]|nr:PEP-CTERM sorting domain-containing protein [Fimbriimonadaceae bacterium]
MKGRFGVACLAGAVLAGQASATIVNISTHLGANPVEVTVGSIKHVGVTLSLGPGTHTVTPIDTSGGGAYTAANRFSQVNLPFKGWEWNVFVSTDGGLTGVKHGYGGGSPSNDDPYQATAAAAFAAAPAPFLLTYGSATDVTFFWLDDNFGDNTGGISIDVSSPVPEPFTLSLVGLALATAVRRRRKLA